ncbi:MAG: hypothetical protein GYA55_12065, partial [SAR324 cluster bacterium]|nr:hypothetical protein [SAR324 cluster bacterium]
MTINFVSTSDAFENPEEKRSEIPMNDLNKDLSSDVPMNSRHTLNRNTGLKSQFSNSMISESLISPLSTKDFDIEDCERSGGAFPISLNLYRLPHRKI